MSLARARLTWTGGHRLSKLESVRRQLEILRVRAVRPLLRILPRVRGRFRLSSLLLASSLNGPYPGPHDRIVQAIPSGTVVRCRHGLKLRVHRDPAFIWPYLFGEYEEANTRIYKELIRPGATVFDIGASYGWFTALFAKAVGRSGQVHAFEPVAEIARLTAETVELNDVSLVVHLNVAGVGREAGSFIVYTFDELPMGHASSSDLGRDDAVPHHCHATSLDEYVAQRGIETADFIKVDVEGHERDVLCGAEATLSARDAPVVAFEVNPECLAARRLTPAKVQEPLVDFGYDHFWLIEPEGNLREVPGPAAMPATADYLAAKGERVLRVQEAAAASRRRGG